MTRKITVWGWRGRENSVTGGRENQLSTPLQKREGTVISSRPLCTPPEKKYVQKVEWQTLGLRVNALSRQRGRKALLPSSLFFAFALVPLDWFYLPPATLYSLPLHLQTRIFIVISTTIIKNLCETGAKNWPLWMEFLFHFDLDWQLN